MAELPRLFVLSLLYTMLCYKSPTQAKMKSFVYIVSAHTGRAGQLSGKLWRLLRLGVLQEHGESRGGCFDCIRFKKICEAERSGSKTALQGPPFKDIGVGDRFLFKPLEYFFLAQKVKIYFIKNCLSVNKFCSNKN